MSKRQNRTTSNSRGVAISPMYQVHELRRIYEDWLTRQLERYPYIRSVADGAFPRYIAAPLAAPLADILSRLLAETYCCAYRRGYERALRDAKDDALAATREGLAP